MMEGFLENVKDLEITKDLQIEKEELERKQNKFLESNLGKVIDSGINIALKAVLPNFIEDEVIAVKDSLVTEGFSAAVDTAIKESVNIGKSLTGIVTGTFENISQVKKAIEKGGLIDTISSLIDTGIDWAKKGGHINKNVAALIKNGKNTIMNIIGDNVGQSLEKQVESVEKLSGYINKWEKYYEEKNFTNMEYQYNKIQEYLKEVIPLEKILKKARVIENIHELVKNNGKNFDITQEQRELAEIL